MSHVQSGDAHVLDVPVQVLHDAVDEHERTVGTHAVGGVCTYSCPARAQRLLKSASSISGQVSYMDR